MKEPIGRFAPSPTGRMHLGNVYAALMSYLSVKSRGGRWILRIEDIDPQRSRMEYARQLEDDLLWLGMQWDEGGVDGIGNHGPYVQSERGDIYLPYYNKLMATGLTYPCYCTRSDLTAASAPHASDGRVVYSGRCRPETGRWVEWDENRPASTRIIVPDKEIDFCDCIVGDCSFNLARDCGDFIIRRKDGAWAYQLAVVVDDALMGVTEVMRGDDLLLSTAQQIYLYELLGFDVPQFAHLPLLKNDQGVRLSKRDGALSMEVLRQNHSPESLLGHIAYMAGLIDGDRPVSLAELTEKFSIDLLCSHSCL